MTPKYERGRSRRVLPLLIGLLVGLAIAGGGALLFLAQTSPESAGSREFVHDGSTSEGTQNGDRLTEDRSLRSIDSLSELEAHLGSMSTFERSMGLQEFVSQLGLSQLTRLRREADGTNTPSFLNQFEEAVTRDIALVDPRGALSIAYSGTEERRNRHVSIVFQEWSIANLDAAIAHASTFSGSMRNAALEGILRSRIDLSDEERQEIARGLGNEQFALDQQAIASLNDSLPDPEERWSEFLSFHGSKIEQLSEVQQDLLVDIAHSWIEQRGLVEAISGISNATNNYDDSVAIVGLLLQQVLSEDPRLGLGTAAQMSSEVRSIIVNGLAIWAKQDPESAMEIASLMESDGTRLMLRRAAIGAWMKVEPRAVIDAKERLPEVLHPWIEQAALLSMGRTSPASVPQYLSGITNETTKEIVAINLALNWAREDPMAVFEWAISDPQIEKWQHSVLRDAFTNMAKQDPEKAFRLALEQPAMYESVGWEASVVDTVARSDLDSAMSMLDRVRNDETREETLTWIGQSFMNSGQYDRALEWSEKLKEESRTDFLTRMFWQFPLTSKDIHKSALDRLPTDELREEAAKTLLSRNEWDKKLTPKQIEELNQYVSEESSNASE